ncbi:hypothetical protein CBD41_05660 [bacterium TMED181]|nr:hypothetical protein [Planctomycetota bacterium]OUW44438.1 MAG: hypothetical protein CBD41_05660 [bacterium TMED181]
MPAEAFGPCSWDIGESESKKVATPLPEILSVFFGIEGSIRDRKPLQECPAGLAHKPTSRTNKTTYENASAQSKGCDRGFQGAI